MKLKDLFYIGIFSILFAFNLIDRNPTHLMIHSVFSLQDQPLQVSTKLLTPEESKSILKYNLLARRYKPIEVTISNSGSHTYKISRASTSLACAQAEDIAWKETKKSFPRGVGFKVLGFIFWPFTIPSALDSLHTFKKHRSTTRVLKAKGFKDEAEIIPPYSLVKRVLYIPEAHFVKDFTLALEDVTADELVVIPVQVSDP